MSAARRQLLERLKTLDLCVVDPVAADGLPADIQKNAVAALVRGGLAVMAFAITEAFLRDRVAEILRSFNGAALSFADLSDRLQRQVTLGALEGLRYRVRLQPAATRISWALSELPPIASAGVNISNLSALSFGNDSANIRSEDVKGVLSALGIREGWSSISRLAARLGLGGVPDYEQEFENLAARRHAAAHDVTSHVLQSQLADVRKNILGICAPFDLLISHAGGLHNRMLAPHRTGTPLDHSSIRLRVVSPHPINVGAYREAIETAGGGRHTVRVHPGASAAETAAVASGASLLQHVAVLDASGIVEKWITW